MSENSHTPITATHTIQQWLDHPKGGPVLRGFLEQAGSDIEQLRPALGLPLGNLVEMSGGRMPQEAIDGMVLAANDGVMPETATAPAAGGNVSPAGPLLSPVRPPASAVPPPDSCWGRVPASSEWISPRSDWMNSPRPRTPTT